MAVSLQDRLLALQNKYAFQGKPEDYQTLGGGTDWNAFTEAEKAWQAQQDANIIADQNNIKNQYASEIADPYISITQADTGVPGVSLPKSEYDKQLAKYAARTYGTDANGNPLGVIDTSSPTFGQGFANFLRNTNAPKPSDPNGTFLSQYQGLNVSGPDAVKMAQAQRAIDRSKEFKLGKAIAGLSGGLVLSGMGGIALGGLAGGAGLGSGVAAGEAASGLNFAAGAAAKGALSGAASGYLSSGKLGGALKGAALGGLTGGYGSSLGSSLGITSQAGQSAFTGALTGASGGIVNKDPKDALIGAALGGGLGYIQGGGLGTAAGTPLATTSGNAALQGPTAGTGIAGAVTRTIPDLGSFFPSGQESGGIQNMKSLLSPIASIYSDYNSNKALSDATKKALMGGDRAALGLEPYNQIGLNAQKALSGNLSQGFNPSDLASDAGYQFRLGESQKALDRSLSSTGMTQSGAAIKAAQDRAQGLAATGFGDAYNRWLAQNQQLASLGSQGLQGAGALGDIYMGQGNVQGAASLAKADTRNKTIAEILAGLYS